MLKGPAKMRSLPRALGIGDSGARKNSRRRVRFRFIRKALNDRLAAFKELAPAGLHIVIRTLRQMISPVIPHEIAHAPA